MINLNIDDLEFQIKELQKDYDYNLREYPVEVILQKFKKDESYVNLTENTSSIYIPSYQRDYVWKEDRKCKFIESLFLGVPIPPLFAFTLDDSGNMELIDGVQRLSTIEEFVSGNLRINGVELLDKLNGYIFSDLHPARKRKFNSLGIRIYVLSENADESVRGDIYNRINSTGVKLTPAEIRKGAFLGNKFYDFILECIEIEEFKKLFSATKSKEEKLRGEREELISRFFAYSDSYKLFEHSVKHFINEFIIGKGRDFSNEDKENKRKEFFSMLKFVQDHIPNGFKKSDRSKSIPRVRFEALSVGTILALRENPALNPNNFDWIKSDQFKIHTTSDASNNKSKLIGRIEFVRDCLLGNIRENLTYEDLK